MVHSSEPGISNTFVLVGGVIYESSNSAENPRDLDESNLTHKETPVVRSS